MRQSFVATRSQPDIKFSQPDNRSEPFLKDGMLNGAHPFHRIRLFIGLLLAVATCVTLPLGAFIGGAYPLNGGYLALFYLIDCFYIMDTLAEMNSGYIDTWGRPVYDREVVKSKYIHSYVFWLDVLGSIPLEFGGYAAGLGAQGIAQLMLLRILRCHRIFTNKLLSGDSLLHQQLHLLLILVLSYHWISTMYCGISIDTGHIALYADEDFADEYVTCLYWGFVTMFTVGYGDFVPTSKGERLYVIITIVVGTMFYSVLFGNMSLLIDNRDIYRKEHRLALYRMDTFIKNHQMPPELGQKLRRSLIDTFHLTQGVNVQYITSFLPQGLKGDVMLHLHSDLLRKAPWFATVKDEVIRALVTRLDTLFFNENDYICQQGMPATEMYFLSHGVVEVVIKKGSRLRVVRTYSDGATFGEIGLLATQKRTASCIAKTKVELASLSVEMYDEVMYLYPQASHQINDDVKKGLDQAQEAGEFGDMIFDSESDEEADRKKKTSTRLHKRKMSMEFDSSMRARMQTKSPECQCHFFSTFTRAQLQSQVVARDTQLRKLNSKIDDMYKLLHHIELEYCQGSNQAMQNFPLNKGRNSDDCDRDSTSSNFTAPERSSTFPIPSFAKNLADESYRHETDETVGGNIRASSLNDGSHAARSGSGHSLAAAFSKRQEEKAAHRQELARRRHEVGSHAYNQHMRRYGVATPLRPQLYARDSIENDRAQRLAQEQEEHREVQEKRRMNDKKCLTIGFRDMSVVSNSSSDRSQDTQPSHGSLKQSGSGSAVTLSDRGMLPACVEEEDEDEDESEDEGESISAGQIIMTGFNKESPSSSPSDTDSEYDTNHPVATRGRPFSICINDEEVTLTR